MVQSGLTYDVTVSHYRLIAFITCDNYSFYDFLENFKHKRGKIRIFFNINKKFSLRFNSFNFFQISLGALVSG